MKINKKLLHIPIILLMAAVLSFALYFIRYSFIDDSATKTNGYFVNDVFDSPSAQLENHKTLTQEFTANSDIYGVKIRFHNGGQPQAGSLKVEIAQKENGNIVLSQEFNSQTLLNDSYTALNFDTPYKNTKETDFILKLTPNFDAPNGYMKIWQDTEKGNIALGIVSYIVSGFIYSWFRILSVLVILSAVIIYLACFVFNLKKETVFLICLLTISVLFNFVLPPYSSPDEEAHMHSAYMLSNRWFEGYSKEEIFNTGTVYKRAEDYSDIFEDKYTTVFSYEYIYNNFFKFSKDNRVIPQPDSWHVGDSAAVNAAGAIGLQIGKVLNLGYVPLLYLGRLANLALFALCGYMAVKLAPIGKEIFMVLCLLPITLHLANSFSRDTFVLAAAFLFIAYLLHLLYQKENTTIKDLVLISLIAVLLAPAKMIYFGISLLIFLLAKDNLKGLKLKIKPVYLVAAVAGAAVTAVLSSHNWVIDYIKLIFNGSSDMETLLQQNPEKLYDLAIILSNPVVTLKLVLNTVYTNFAYYIKSICGGVLGYNSINISDAFIIVFLALISLSVFNMPQEKIQLKKWHKISFMAVFCLVFALVIYVSFSWTPITYTTLYGIQGKYFMPAVPLLLLCLKGNTFTAEKDIFKPMCFAAGITNIFVALNAFVVILQR